MAFVALENGLKSDEFSGWSWGHPRSWQSTRLGVIGSFPGPITTIPGSLKLRKEYIGYMVHWKRDYTYIILRSLVPPQGGQRIYYLRAMPSATGPHSREYGCVEGLCCADSSALLRLLLVCCFECFGFPVKCMEASCFLEVVSYGFSICCGCYLGHNLFWVSKTYRLTGLVPPFSHLEDHFASLGTPERTMEGHMGAQNQIFSDFA